ncbi:terminase, partial [Acinetobacter baumannii]
HVGMDFNVQKMAAVVYVRDGEELYAVGEFKDLFDTPAMIEAIKAKYQDHEIIVYPDASGDNRKSSNASETDIALLKKAGFK